MKRVNVVGAVRRKPGDWEASRSVFEVRLDGSGYDHVMNAALALNLGIRAGWQGTLCAVADGEAVPRAEFALRGEERIDQGLIAALVRAGESMRDECWDAVKAWRNAALGEPARDDTHRVQMREGAYEQEEIAASVVHVTWQDVKDRAENAIREIPDAPKKAKVPTAVFYRRPTLPGPEHTFPYLCSCCGEGTRGMNGLCGHCSIEGVVGNLPEGDDA